jgi:hypothetical protein
MAIGVERVSRRLDLVLAALKRGAEGRARVAITALAEGSDRLFAVAALKHGFRLEVLLPFATSDYETTFGDKAETAAFRDLLAHADRWQELPGALSDTKSAYEEVGRKTVDASDILVTIWDGKPAAGRGGTPEIIDYAIGRRKPVIWIDAARDRLPILITASTAKAHSTVQLAHLASRGERLTQAKLRKLVCTVTHVFDAPRL